MQYELAYAKRGRRQGKVSGLEKDVWNEPTHVFQEYSVSRTEELSGL